MKKTFHIFVLLMLAAALLSLSAFAADNVRYVANAAMGTGDGLTAENATTLDKAFTELNTNVFTKAEHAGETCTIYLVEDITLMQYRPEGTTSPRTTQVFSENAHADNAVAILTMPGKAKATVTFPYGSTAATRVYNYLLSGETRFDNVIFTTGAKGSTQIPTIAAHGHKLTLGKGVKTVKADGCHGIAVAGITFSANTFRTKQGEKAANVFTPDVTVLGGEYEYITAFSNNVAVAKGSSAKLTLGNVKVGTLTATNHTGGMVNADTSVEIVYTGKVEAEKFWPTRRPTDANPGNASTFTHTLLKGAELIYTEINVAKAGSATLNLRFDPTDAAVAKQAKALYDALSGNANIGTFTFSTVTTDPVCADDVHVKVTAKLTEVTCAEGAMEYDYCSVCGKMLSEIRKGEPDKSKHNVKDVAWILSDDGTQYIRKCSICGNLAAEYPVTDGKVAVYVSANGNANGGESKENPVDTLRGAQNLAAKLAETYYGVDDNETPVTIYVIGRVDMPSRIFDASGALVSNKVSDSTLNRFTQCFEETPHVDHPFVFTSLNGAERGLLNFLIVDTSTNTRNMTYMLYGPTTFENISFGAAGGTYEGVTYTARQGHSIIGRGFKLVLGEGITMVDNEGKISNNTNRDVVVSDIKLYVSGGFYASGNTHANCAVRKDTDSYDADLTVLSGEYWFVGALNRNVPSVSDTTSTLTVGAPAVMYLSAVSTGATDLTNVRTDIHYRGAANIRSMYLGTQNKGTDGVLSTYTCNHLFFPGSSGMYTASITATYRDEINIYYYGSDSAKAKEIAGTRSINKFDTMAEYCIDWRGGHTVGADGKCTFCGVKPCTGAHDYSSFAYVTEATCTEKATGYYYCTNCHDRLELIEIGEENQNGHDYRWNTDGEPECTYCHKILRVSEPYVYVSDLAFAGEADGRTAETPLRSYNDAYMLAVATARRLGGSKAVLCIVGCATIPIDFYEGTYLEPEHADIEMTVKGYGGAKLNYGKSTATRLEYGLNGPTVFANLEISSGENETPIYISARHNHLTMANGIVLRFERSQMGSEHHKNSLTLVGGCYSSRFGSCDASDTYMTLYSGNYHSIVGGSSGRACGLADGVCMLELFGDVTARDSIFGGSFGVDTGDVHMVIAGNIVAGAYPGIGTVVFGGSRDQTAGDVRVELWHGSITCFGEVPGYYRPYGAPIGCTSATDSILANKQSLTIVYDPCDVDSSAMKQQIVETAIDGDRVTFVSGFMTDSSSLPCTVNADGVHTRAGAIPTCDKYGNGIFTCEACGALYYVAQTAHDWEEAPELDKPGYCRREAERAIRCTTCGAVAYRKVSGTQTASRHWWSKRKSVIETPCGTANVRQCAYCYTEEILPLTGTHAWDNGVVVKAATVSDTGVMRYTCTSCGAVRDEMLPALAFDGPMLSLVPSADALDAGETYTVDVMLANNPGIWGLDFVLHYDHTVFEDFGVSGGDCFPVTAGKRGQDVLISFSNSELADSTANGRVATLSFRVRADAPLGSTKLEFVSVDAVNIEEESVHFAGRNLQLLVARIYPVGILFRDETYVYDGTEKKHYVRHRPLGTSSYSTYNGEAASGVTAAGTYAVETTVTGESYLPVTLSATLTITPSPLTLTALDVFNKTCTLYGVFGEDDVTLDFDALRVEKRDNNWVATNLTLAGADSINYTLATTFFTIVPTAGADGATVTVLRQTDSGAPVAAATYTALKGYPFTLTADTLEHAAFVKWTDTDGRLLSEEAVVSLTPTADETLIACYAVAHVYAADFTVDTPTTCTVEGVKSRHCRYCDARTDVTAIPAAHTWDDGIIVTAPTALAEGEMRYTCKRCGTTRTESIPMLTTPALTLVAPQGAAQGDTVSVRLLLTGNPGIWGPTVNIAYDAERLEIVEVDNGDIYAASELHGVNLAKNPLILSYNPRSLDNNTKNGTLATLTFRVKASAPAGTAALGIAGYDIINADVESVFFSTFDTSVSVHAHSYGAWTERRAASCTAGGEEVCACTVCGSEKTRTTTALGHDFAADFTVDTPATCTAEGVKSRHCTRCDRVTDATVLPKQTHSYGAWTERRAASCTAGGEEVCACTVCGREETRTTTALGHDFAAAFTVDTPATCTAEGVKSRHCTRCDLVTDETVIAALGHAMPTEPTEPEIPPTVRAEGRTAIYRCQNPGCDYYTGGEAIPRKTAGDVNADGEINKADLLRLQKHLAGWEVELDLAAADCNGDCRVNKLDLLRLQKYLAGWNVRLGQ